MTRSFDLLRYILNVLQMLGENRRFFLWAALAGLGLRIFFFAYVPAVTDDSRVYIDLASNWLQHGIYGQTELGQIVATDTRLPGYPAFLAAIFWLFGVGNIRAALAAQILLDMVACLAIADLARRTVTGRVAGPLAFLLAATCPFLANYAASGLTETLEVLFTAVTLDCLAAGLDCIGENVDNTAPGWPFWTAAGASIGACILLRPDGGILLAAVGIYLGLVITGRRSNPVITKRAMSGAHLRRAIATAGITIAVIALAPLVPWTIRNFRALHHFEPLAPRYANEPEELTPRGFNAWVKTWMAEYASVEEIYWNVQGDKIDANKLPSRALDEPGRDETLALIADYNQTQELTARTDERFAALAEERIRAHPVRYYVVLPALRVADMWLRPRTELLPADPRWWEFNDDRRESALAVGFGLLNLIYVASAFLAVTRGTSRLRYVGLLAGFLLLRSVFLGTIENPEPRYTLECYPVVMVWAAAFWSEKFERRLRR
jgi:hypothetical protein